MTSINPSGTKVVIIGCSEFEDGALSPIPQIKNNVRALAALFRSSKRIGIDPTNICSVLDPATPDVALKALVTNAKSARDTLIVYYAGHGMIGRNKPDLFLAVKNTPQNDPDTFGISFDEKVRSIVKSSPAPKRILILDCCFSGRATFFMGMGDLVRANIAVLKGEGTYVLAASKANQLATFGGHPRYTDFTGELIRVIKHGVVDAGETITTSTLHKEISTAFAKKSGMPDPQQLIINQGGHISVAINRMYPNPSVTVSNNGVNTSAASATASKSAAETLEALSLNGPVRRERTPRASLFRGLDVLHRNVAGIQLALVALGRRLIGNASRFRPACTNALVIAYRWLVEWMMSILLFRWLYIRPDLVIGSGAAAFGTGLAIVQSKGWEFKSLHPLFFSSNDRFSFTVGCLADIVWGPWGLLAIALVTGALAGLRPAFTDEEKKTADKVSELAQRRPALKREPGLTNFVIWWRIKELLRSLASGAMLLFCCWTCALLFSQLGMGYPAVLVGTLLGLALGSRCISISGSIFFAALGSVGLLVALIVIVNIVGWVFDIEVSHLQLAIPVTHTLFYIITLLGLARIIAIEHDLSPSLSWLMARSLLLALAWGFWTTRFSTLHMTLEHMKGQGVSAQFVRNGTGAIAVSANGTIIAWPTLAQPGISISREKVENFLSLDYSPAGILVTGSGRMTKEPDPVWEHRADDCTVRVWAAPEGALLARQYLDLVAELRGHTRLVYDVAISPADSNLVISAGGDGVKTWDVQKKALRISPPFATATGAWAGHSDIISGLAFSPDGQSVATASFDKTVRVVNANNSTEWASRVFSGHQDMVYCLDYSHDGALLASGGKDATLRIWDTKSGNEVKLISPGDVPLTVAFSPDDSVLACAREDSRIVLVSVTTGKELQQISAHGPSIRELEFSPDGKLLLVTDAMGFVRVWHVLTQKQ